MIPDSTIIKKLNKSFKSKVNIGNEELIQVKGQGIATVQIDSSNKIITNILYTSYINQNLLSIR